MSPIEFKNEFLLEYDSHASNRAPGMNGYMISYWLTRSEQELVKDYLTPKSNRRQEGFEQTETRRRKLAHLVRLLELTSWTTGGSGLFSTDSKNFEIVDKRILEIKQEHLILTEENPCDGSTHLKVTPIASDDLNDSYKNPFRKPNMWNAWRIDTGTPSTKTINLEIVTPIDFTTYILRYVMRPFPIIVEDLTNINPTLSIDGETAIRTCELDEQFHPEIVTRAVTRALENISNPRFQSHAAMDQLQIE